jgi:hypothetical protein
MLGFFSFIVSKNSLSGGISKISPSVVSDSPYRVFILIDRSDIVSLINCGDIAKNTHVENPRHSSMGDFDKRGCNGILKLVGHINIVSLIIVAKHFR